MGGWRFCENHKVDFGIMQALPRRRYDGACGEGNESGEWTILAPCMCLYEVLCEERQFGGPVL